MSHRLKTRWLRHRGGPGPRTPILVFLHEGLGCIDLWGSFPADLCTRTGLDGLVYDRLGHGRSDPLPSAEADPDYLLDEARTSLPALLDQNGIKRCILIGHSDGGSIALIFAAENRHRVQGIVTEAAHVRVDHLTLAAISTAAAAYEHGELKSKLARYHGNNTDTLFRRWADTWRTPEFCGRNLIALLPGINCPVLAIQGMDDEYGLPDQARDIATGVGGPGLAWLVPDCRHEPHRQAAEAVLDRCTRFIQGIIDPADMDLKE